MNPSCRERERRFFDGIPFYQAAYHRYDDVALMNVTPTNINCSPTLTGCGPPTVCGYGQPDRHQAGRPIRLRVFFTF